MRGGNSIYFEVKGVDIYENSWKSFYLRNSVNLFKLDWMLSDVMSHSAVSVSMFQHPTRWHGTVKNWSQTEKKVYLNI